jgi:hypothetical protein
MAKLPPALNPKTPAPGGEGAPNNERISFLTSFGPAAAEEPGDVVEVPAEGP